MVERQNSNCASSEGFSGCISYFNMFVLYVTNSIRHSLSIVTVHQLDLHTGKDRTGSWDGNNVSTYCGCPFGSGPHCFDKNLAIREGKC